MSMGAPGALGTGGGPSTANNRVITLMILLITTSLHGWQHGNMAMCSQVASPETETKALCSAVPPLVTMRSV